MNGGDSSKDFDACGDCDDHSCGCKVSSGVYIYTYGEYMVGSNYETKEANGCDCVDYSKRAESFFLSTFSSDNMRD